VSEIAAGENFSLFLRDGVVYGAGDNSSGQINCQLKKKYAMEPTEIPIKNVSAIRAGKFAAAVLEDKQICVWGLK
jgi:alpha-tubulin suppressor-like RCC1 family protein